MKIFLKNKIVWIVLGTVGVISLAYYAIYQDIRNNYIQAEIAYHLADETQALEHYQSVSRYPTLFGEYVTKSEIKLLELQTYIDAQQLWESGENADAIDSYDQFSQDYPDSSFYDVSQSALRMISFEWADEMVIDEDYSNAIAQYKDIVDNSDFSSEEIFQANNLIFEVYQQWGNHHYELDAFSQAIEVYSEFAAWLSNQVHLGFRTDVDIQQANIIIADIYLEWAQISYGTEDYAQTVETYLAYQQWTTDNQFQSPVDINPDLGQASYYYGLQLLEDEKPYEQITAYFETAIENGENDIVRLASVEISGIYLDWANDLMDANEDAFAGEKYWALLKEYPNSGAASQVNEQAYPAIVMWGHILFANEEFDESRILYEYMQGLIEPSQQEIVFKINLNLGQIAHHETFYLDALNYYLTAAEFTGSITENESTLANVQQATLDVIGNDSSDEGQDLLYMMVVNTIGREIDEGEKCIEFSDDLGTVCIRLDMAELLSNAIGTNQDDIRYLILIQDRNNNQEIYPDLDLELQANNLANFHYLVVIKKSIADIEDCSSSNKYSSIRQKIIYSVSTFKLKSGSVTAQQAFVGEEPDRICLDPAKEWREVNILYYSIYHVGPPPDMNEIYKWIDSVIH